MKKVFLALTLLFIVSCVFVNESKGQVEVVKSTDKVKIGDTLYYVHIVKAQETLYSISKAYNVTQAEIAIANPDINVELKVGQALKIPVKDQPDEPDDRYIYHIVKRRETIYSLSRKYGISQEDIIALNPAIKSGLKRSQVVLIPKAPQARDEQQVPDSIEFKMHIVERGEGLYGIARKYNVSTREVEFYNRAIFAQGLRPGVILSIPIAKAKGADTSLLAQNAALDSLNLFDTSYFIVPQCDSTYLYNGEAFNIALLLPFTQVSASMLGDGDGERPANVPSARANSATTRSALEFYEGFLLALDYMKAQGVSVNLSVFDTKKQPVEVNNIIRQGKLLGSQLIISPFFIDEILPLAQYAVANGINMVSPSYNGPTPMPVGNTIITVNQSFKQQFEAFIHNLELSADNNYIVVVDAADSLSSAMAFCDSLIDQEFGDAQIDPKIYTHHLGMNSIEAQRLLAKRADTTRNNVIIVVSEDEPFVSEMLGNIYGVRNLYKISTQVFGPARWRNMKNISTEYLYNINLFIYTPFYLDFGAPQVREFIEVYRDMYRAEPSKLSFLGYDVGHYFISALKKFGPRFNNCLYTYKMHGLQSDFMFKSNRRTRNLHNMDQIMVRYTENFETVSLNASE